VHRQHALQRQHVIEKREDRLLDLTGVLRARNQDEPLRKVDDDRGLGTRPVARRIGLEVWCGDHRELRRVGRALPGIVFGQKHVPGKEAVPCEFGDNANRHPERGIGPGPRIQDKQLLVTQVAADVSMQHIEVAAVERTIDVAPVDVAVARGFLDEELVIRRAAGVRSRAADQRPLSRQQAFAAGNGVLVQRGGAQIPVGTIRFDDANGIEAPAPSQLASPPETSVPAERKSSQLMDIRGSHLGYI
jgi:hypothetical protein